MNMNMKTSSGAVCALRGGGEEGKDIHPIQRNKHLCLPLPPPSLPPALLLGVQQYPQHMQAVVCCLEAFADVPAVTTPLLKFMSEFVFNKSQRLTFDSSSANGILLFREVGVGGWRLTDTALLKASSSCHRDGRRMT